MGTLIYLRTGLGPSQRTDPIKVDLEETVEQLMLRLAVPGNVTLMFQNQVLEGFFTLSWYDIKAEDTLHLVRKELCDEPAVDLEREERLAALRLEQAKLRGRVGALDNDKILAPAKKADPFADAYERAKQAEKATLVLAPVVADQKSRAPPPPDEVKPTVFDSYNQGNVSLKIERSMVHTQHVTTVVAFLGIFFALVEDDACFASCVHYEDRVCLGSEGCCLAPRPPTCDLYSPSLKAIISLSTLIFILCLARVYQLEARFIALRNHIWTGSPLKHNSFRQTGLLGSFLVELLIGIIHVPPVISFSVDIAFQKKVATYRIESLVCLFMFVRLFQLWKSFKGQFFLKHAAVVKTIASQLYRTHLGSAFALKSALEDHPTKAIGVFFALYSLTAAYFIKIAEAPVQVSLTSYYWNSCWFIVVTMTSTGYGDMTPVTHVGRAIAVLSMIVGALITAVLTSAAVVQLSLSSAEHSTKLFLEQHQHRLARRIAAARVIQRWKRDGYKPTTKASRKAQLALRTTEHQYAVWKRREPHVGRQLNTVMTAYHELHRKIEQLTESVHVQMLKMDLELKTRPAGNPLAAGVPAKVICPHCRNTIPTGAGQIISRAESPRSKASPRHSPHQTRRLGESGQRNLTKVKESLKSHSEQVNKALQAVLAMSTAVNMSGVEVREDMQTLVRKVKGNSGIRHTAQLSRRSSKAAGSLVIPTFQRERGIRRGAAGFRLREIRGPSFVLGLFCSLWQETFSLISIPFSPSLRLAFAHSVMRHRLSVGEGESLLALWFCQP